MINKSTKPSERKYFNLPLMIPTTCKNIAEDGCISGYASVFDIVDKHSDIILHGAFTNTIREHHLHNSIKLLWQHHTDEPIGVIQKIREDEYGLYIEAKLIFAIQRAREACELIKAGAVCSLSIGYNVVKQHNDYEQQLRVIEEVDLWEISIVTFPANSEAKISAVKQDEGWGQILVAIRKAEAVFKL